MTLISLYALTGVMAWLVFATLELRRFNRGWRDVHIHPLLLSFTLFLLFWPWMVPFVIYERMR